MVKLLSLTPLLAALFVLNGIQSASAYNNEGDEMLSVLTDGHGHYLPLERRSNFLRFGRASDPELISSKLNSDDDHRLNRRDYREFVRFGKKDWPNMGQICGPRCMKLLLSSMHKRSNDFLRFGKK